jgi:hypothetical protein
VTVAGGNKLDGLWFETWSRLSRRGVVDYCSSVVWQVGSSGGLVESLGSQQYVVWQIANPVDGLPVTCHGEL